MEALTFQGKVGISWQMNESDVFKPSTHSDFVSYTGDDIARKGTFYLFFCSHFSTYLFFCCLCDKFWSWKLFCGLFPDCL